MDIEKICINNLGKEVDYGSLNRSHVLASIKWYKGQLVL